MNTGNAYSHNKCYTWSYRVPLVKDFFPSQLSLVSLSLCDSTYTVMPQHASGCTQPLQVSAAGLAVQQKQWP